MANTRIIGALLCSLLVTAPGLAQNGYLDNDPIWSGHAVCNTGFEHCFQQDDYNEFLCGDTLIADTLYHKLCRHGISDTYWYYSPPPSPYCNIGTSTYQWLEGFIREDGKQLFFRPIGESDEPLYDFDLEVGDTLPNTYVHPIGSAITVVSIDSLLIGPNWRKRFQLDAQGAFLLEGIGNSAGLLQPFEWAYICGATLTCFGLTDTAYFPAQGEDCDLHVSVREEPLPPRMTAFPNPSTGEFDVLLPSAAEKAIVLDDLGRVASELICGSRSNIRLELATPGIYTLVIFTPVATLCEKLVVVPWKIR